MIKRRDLWATQKMKKILSITEKSLSTSSSENHFGYVYISFASLTWKDYQINVPYSASGTGKLSATREKHCTTLHNEYFIAKTETLPFFLLAAPFSEQSLHPRAEGCWERGCSQGGPSSGGGGCGHLLPRVSRQPGPPTLSFSLTVSTFNIIVHFSNVSVCLLVLCCTGQTGRSWPVWQCGAPPSAATYQVPNSSISAQWFNCILWDLSTTS